MMNTETATYPRVGRKTKTSCAPSVIEPQDLKLRKLSDMTKKSLLLVGFVSACSLALAGTKSYDIVFERPASVGAVQLAAGEYKFKLENGTATFTDVQTGKSVTAPAKIETAAKKYPHTAIDAFREGKSDRVAAIQLGGSTSKVEFTTGTAAQSGM